MAFRVTPEEFDRITKLAATSGMDKQAFIMSKLEDHKVVVKPSMRVYRALKDEMAAIYQQLLRVRAGGELSASMEASIELLTQFFAGLNPSDAIEAEVDKENDSIWNMERW